MFNSATADEARGKYAPLRGQVYKLSDHENLVYLIGQRELKQVSDGHPRGLILSVHKDSTFKDVKYLSAQLFNFSAHSWRSYFPNPMPVTFAEMMQVTGWQKHSVRGFLSSLKKTGKSIFSEKENNERRYHFGQQSAASA